MNKENCALKLVDEIILYYDSRSKKHQIYVSYFCSPQALAIFTSANDGLLKYSAHLRQ